MTDSKSLRRVQTIGLLIRMWHWQRRQHCANLFSFILTPVILVLLAVLNRSLKPEEFRAEPYELTPQGGFAPRPFDPSICARGADITDPEVINRCLADPFQPEYKVPVYIPSSLTAAIGSHDATSSKNNSGLLAGYSLDPFEYLPAVDPSFDFFSEQTMYDGALQYDVFNGNKDIFNIFSEIIRSRQVDAIYNASTFTVESRADLLSTLYDGWYRGGRAQRYSSAFSFDTFSVTPEDVSVSYTVFYNESQSAQCTRLCPLISGITRMYDAIYKEIIPTKSVSVYLRRMPLVDVFDSPRFLSLVISILIVFLTHFQFPNFLHFLASERTDRMRGFMMAMGVRRPYYWVATYLSILFMFIISTVFLIIIGFAVRIPFFVDNTPVSYLILFFLWGNSLISLAIFLEPFFGDAQTAKTFGWIYIIVVNIIGGPYIGTLLSNGRTSNRAWAAIMLLPSFAYMRSVYFAGSINSGDKGITLGSSEFRGVQLGMCNSQDGPFCWSYGFLVIDWIILIVLGFLVRRLIYKSRKFRNPIALFRSKTRASLKEGDKSLSVDEPEQSQDVADERLRARQIVMNMQENPFDGVVLDALTKTYTGNPPVRALKKLSLVAQRNDVLCILAHNGAGKTTAFRTLVGELKPTSGDAYINGYSISTEMEKVQTCMGLAAQQDILWADMSVQEHLFFYGRVKGLRKKELREAVEQSLENVQLTEARKRSAKKLSGGMRRRLAVSIAMIGNPEFVLLDEPSTGLDLVARERLWEAIEKMRKDKVVILTTHSLEEAETLSTRVAIMSQGELRCIGSAEELKTRLGKGHRLSVSMPLSGTTTLFDEIVSVVTGATIENVGGSSVDFVLPRGASIPNVLHLITEQKEALGIHDWSIQKSTLEDVFLRVTRDSMKEENSVDGVMAP